MTDSNTASIFAERRRLAESERELSRLRQERERASIALREMRERLKAMRDEHSFVADEELRLLRELEKCRMNIAGESCESTVSPMLRDNALDVEVQDIPAALKRIEAETRALTMTNSHHSSSSSSAALPPPAAAVTAAADQHFITVTVKCDVSIFEVTVDTSAEFLVPPEYTFASLARTACQRFGLSGVVSFASLTDETNVVWGNSMNVQNVLSKLPSQTALQSVVRLVIRRHHAKMGGVDATTPNVNGVRNGENNDSDDDGGGDHADDDDCGDYHKPHGAGHDDADVSTPLLEPTFSLPKALKKFGDNVANMRKLHVLKDSPLFFQPRWEATQPYPAENKLAYKTRIRVTKVKNIRLIRFLAVFHLFYILSQACSLILRSSVEWGGDIAKWTQSALIMRPFAVEQGGGSHLTSTTFAHLSTPDHAWAFLSGPLLDAYPTTRTSTKCTATTCDNTALYILGGIRVQQYRTNMDSCRFKRSYYGRYLRQWGCFGKWTPFTQATSHGQESVYANASRHDALIAERADMVNTMNAKATLASEEGYDGFVYYERMPRSANFETEDQTLGSSGFPVDLPSSRSAAAAKLWALRRSGWIDRATRAVTLDFNLISSNFNLVVVLHLNIEFTVEGAVATSYTLSTIRFSVYNYATGVTFVLLLLCDIYAVFYNVVFGFRTVSILLRYGIARFVQSIWSLLDLATSSFFIVQIVLSLLFELVFTRPYDLRLPHFDNMRGIAAVRFVCIFLQSASLLCSSISMIQYFQLNDPVRRIFRTLGAAFPSLSVAFFMFLLMQLIFANCLYFLFGASDDDFSGAWKSISTVFFMFGGHLDVNQLIRHDRTAAYVFLSSYSILNILFFPALFTAIIHNAYDVVTTMEGREEERNSVGFWQRIFFGAHQVEQMDSRLLSFSHFPLFFFFVCLFVVHLYTSNKTSGAGDIDEEENDVGVYIFVWRQA